MKNSMMKVAEIEGEKTNFKLIPILPECPFVEARFSLEKKQLTIISKITYDAFKMMVKLDDAGKVMGTKPTKTSAPEPKYERLRSTNFYDYSITERADIEKMVNHLTGEKLNFDEYFKVEEKADAKIPLSNDAK